MTQAGGSGRWIIAAVPAGPGASGGSIRAHAIFQALARRTGAALLGSAGGRDLVGAMLRRPASVTRLASAQFIAPRTLRALSAVLRPAVVDMHDHPVLQAEALGVPLGDVERGRARRVVVENVARFERVVVPGRAFADLCGLPAARTIVASNGTDTTAIQPQPMPTDRLVVAMASGAAPGRGIEALIEAVRRVRASGVEAQLALALSATGARSATYLEGLRADLRREPWVAVSSPPYGSMSGFLAGATVVAIPHPPGSYYDAVLPVKLFDAMAAGRPLVVTPRTETARIVTGAAAGVVSRGDADDDLAAALADLLASPERARSLGRNGRAAAERDYDWGILSERLADAILDR